MRSAEAAGYRVEVAPAQCKACGFTFDRSRLSKPSKCPACRESRIVEAMIRVAPGSNG
jgi:predicted Zn-ribbon and HTH transcriptional regulator